MSWAEEAAHLGVINNSLRDHRHYAEQGRAAEEGKSQNISGENGRALKKAGGCEKDNNVLQT